MNVEMSFSNVSGNWTGSNRMRVMPEDEYAATAATATVSLVAQGNAATIAYTWSDGGKPQDGALLLTNGDHPGSVSAVWVDSWHQSPQWMELEGTVDDDGVIRLEGSYSGGGWRIALDPSAGDQLRMTMDNIFEGVDYQAVEATYRRTILRRRQWRDHGAGGVEERVRVDDGVHLWTVTSGRGATPVVLCHGGAGLWDYLGPVAELLGDRARVHRWEQRGCGRSDRTGPYSVARHVADLDFLRRHAGHDRWVVAGHSWGAGLALHYALTHPDRVLGLLYLCGTGVGHAWREVYHREADRRLTPAQRARRDELTGRERSAAEERDWRILSYLPDFGDPRRARSLAEAFADVPYPVNLEANAALNAEEKATDEAAMLARCRRLDVPVRVVHGAADPRPVWAVASLVEALPRAELTVLDGVGHLPWLEDPRAFARAVEDLV